MLSLYQRSGRLSTEIEPTVDILDNNRINLTYNIEESILLSFKNYNS